MRAYISGPMTGLPNFNRPAFNRAAEEIRNAGLDVFNPAELILDDSATWADYMKQDIAELLKCDIVITLDGWTASRGARIETQLADDLGIKLISIHGWRERNKREGINK